MLLYYVLKFVAAVFQPSLKSVVHILYSVSRVHGSLLRYLATQVKTLYYCKLQWKRIARHFGVIWKTEQFLQLSGQCLKLLLSRDDLCCSKINLARALLRWFNYDLCSRNAWVGCLVQRLRLTAQEFGAVITTEEFLNADCEIQEALRNQVV